jgi:hypothetical protein
VDDDHAIILPGARALEPLKQGSLDGLCGLYSVINAIRVTVYPEHKLTQSQQYRLFKHGIRFYRRRRKLAKLVRSGMTERAWDELCGELVGYSNAMLGSTIEHRPLFIGLEPLQPRAALGRVKRHIETGYPVLMELAGTYNHYTVVVGYQLGRLHLFDSGPYKWIEQGSCGTAAKKPEARHQLVPGGAIALIRTAPP